MWGRGGDWVGRCGVGGGLVGEVWGRRDWVGRCGVGGLGGEVGGGLGGEVGGRGGLGGEVWGRGTGWGGVG